MKRIRFGLKSLLVVMTVLCVILGLIAQPIAEKRRKDRLLAEIAALGGNVSISGWIDYDRSLGRMLLGFFDNGFVRQRLYRIGFSGRAVTDSELARIAELEFIRHLNLSGAQVTDQGLKVLQRQVNLEWLDLRKTGISDLSLPVLQSFQRLASLRVTGSKITYSALKKLDQKLPYAHFCEERAIEELKSAGVQVTDDRRHLDPLVNNRFPSTIYAGSEAIDVNFYMDQSELVSAEVVALLNHLPSLREATFFHSPFSPGGLSQLEPLPQLKRLAFHSINLTDADLQSLGQQTQLEELTIYNCREITSQGLVHLRRLKNLKQLSISGCERLTPEALSDLREALPECKCEFGP